jgi:hypothetical protein
VQEANWRSPSSQGRNGAGKKSSRVGNKTRRSRLLVARNGRKLKTAPARPSGERRRRTHTSRSLLPFEREEQRVLRPESRGPWSARCSAFVDRRTSFFCANPGTRSTPRALKRQRARKGRQRGRARSERRIRPYQPHPPLLANARTPPEDRAFAFCARSPHAMTKSLTPLPPAGHVEP